MARRMMNRLYYFTIEDESILAEAFAQLEKDVYAITYKVAGTEDVFVTTSETKDAMDRNDIPYNLLAEEDGAKIAVYHSPLSREELGDFEDAVKALALAYRAIGDAPDTNKRLNVMFEYALSRSPTSVELDKFRTSIERFRKTYEADTEAAKQLAPAELPGITRAETAALVNAATVLLNLDEFITKE